MKRLFKTIMGIVIGAPLGFVVGICALGVIMMFYGIFMIIFVDPSNWATGCDICHSLAERIIIGIFVCLGIFLGAYFGWVTAKNRKE